VLHAFGNTTFDPFAQGQGAFDASFNHFAYQTNPFNYPPSQYDVQLLNSRYFTKGIPDIGQRTPTYPGIPSSQENNQDKMEARIVMLCYILRLHQFQPAQEVHVEEYKGPSLLAAATK
jgi:hypothetical protein